MARQAFRPALFRVLLCRSRTVEKMLSIELVVRMCVQLLGRKIIGRQEFLPVYPQALRLCRRRGSGSPGQLSSLLETRQSHTTRPVDPRSKSPPFHAHKSGHFNLGLTACQPTGQYHHKAAILWAQSSAGGSARFRTIEGLWLPRLAGTAEPKALLMPSSRWWWRW